MIIHKEEIEKYIKETERLVDNPSYYGNKIMVKSFLSLLKRFTKELFKINSLVIKDKSIVEVTFNSDYYKELLNSISEKLPIKIRLSKKLLNLSRLNKIKESLQVNTFEIQQDYSKAIDLRLGLILIIFNYYLISYQINNKTIEFCNQMSLINLVDTLDKYLSSTTLFPVAIPNKLVKSFTNSIEFKTLFIQNRSLLMSKGGN